MDATREALKPAQDALERFVLDPVNHDYLMLVKAMRNGIVYGTKVRFPHALVMTFLFKSGTLRSKLLAIFNATKKHATNLATFAFTYKSFILFLRALPAMTPNPTRQRDTALPVTTKEYRKERSADSLLAGMLAGYVVFGRPKAGTSSVNQQIVMYVFARVCLALAALAIQPPTRSPSGYQAGYSSRSLKGGGLLEALAGEDGAESLRQYIRKGSWPVFASLSWGLVMWLFRWYPDLLQPSLRSSMKYLYEEAEHWDGLRNWIVHNK